MNRNVVVIVVIVLVVTGMLVAGKYLARSSAGVSNTVNAKGQPAPDFELKTLDGKSVRLADYKGKAVLLNFWATWCSPCKIEIPWFIELQKQYGPQGLEIVGVSMDDGDATAAVKKFAQEDGITYTVLMGNDKVADEYGGVDALPTTYYIGRDGKITARAFGLISHKDIENYIQDALKQGSASAATGGQ